MPSIKIESVSEYVSNVKYVLIRVKRLFGIQFDIQSDIQLDTQTFKIKANRA